MKKILTFWKILGGGVMVMIVVFIIVNLYSNDKVNLENVNDFVYQLQNINISAIGKTKFDLVIMDYSADGTDESAFSNSQIKSLKDSAGGPKIVLCYMSIGEAEDYRWYWKKTWDSNHDGTPDIGAPEWLGPSNPNWPGNYKVKYWYKEWQNIIFKYLDKIIAADFDGVYLDIIDAYEYWGPGGESGLERETAEDEMVDFVIAIANYARAKKPSFLVFPQNGSGLASHSNYVSTVDGIGNEDLWYNDNSPQSSSHTNEVLRNLEIFKRAGKLILVIDYVTKKDLIDKFYSKAISKGFVPYATTRALDRITVNPGHEPD